MTKKGQIVEIPVTALFYKRVQPDFLSKKEELLWKSEERKYSLFDGFLVGEHSGLENFKLGQRKGIKVGGKKEPLYVIQIDDENNRLFVGAGENHPGLWTSVLSFPKNLLQWNRETTFTGTELKNGISVDLESAVIDHKVPAKLYLFEEQIFLEFNQATLMIIKENPFRILFQNTIIAENNK